jgi:hypothetical protein
MNVIFLWGFFGKGGDSQAENILQDLRRNLNVLGLGVKRTINQR